MAQEQTANDQFAEETVANAEPAQSPAEANDDLGILDADIDNVAQATTDEAQQTEESARERDAQDEGLVEEHPLDKQTYIKQEKTDKPYWYVVYTYSGYEKKVMQDLIKTTQNHNLQDTIIKVEVPEEETIDIKNGKRRKVMRKLYPGYVMVKMFLTDESWYIVRNTRGVTGFVGPGNKPIPLSDSEVRAMGLDDTVRINLDVHVGDTVMVTSGPFESIAGEVEAVDTQKQKVTVRTSLLGRDVSMELDFVLVKKI